MKFFSIFLFALLLQACGQNTDDPGLEEQLEMQRLMVQIEELLEQSVCDEDSSCKFVGLGSKPCGGPQSYLVYSTAVDEDKLTALVEKYNERASEYNRKRGAVSDCAVAPPPSRVICEDGECIGIYDNNTP